MPRARPPSAVSLFGRFATSFLIVACVGPAGILQAGGVSEGAPTTVWILPEIRYQVFEGFGQASMHQTTPKWHGLYAEDAREGLLDWLYTLEDGGLGMTICRFHMPVGDAPGHAHMWRQPYASLNPRGLEPEEDQLQLDGHESILWHARGAAERGATMVAFWNTPPYWLTISGCTMGRGDGTTNNTRAGTEPRFARHIGEVLEKARDDWGLDFDYVCPINEPEGHYWNAESGQEGCHTDQEQAVVIFKALAQELRERGLKAVPQGPEAVSSLDYLDHVMGDPDVASLMPVITCHQYEPDPFAMRKWAIRARELGKRLWMSEWGDWTHLGPEPETRLQQAAVHARAIHAGLNTMQAEAWCVWEPGVLFDMEPLTPRRRKAFWAVAQYCRFIRPGMRRIEAVGGPLRATAWLDEAGGRVALVIFNPSRELLAADIDLSTLGAVEILEARRTSAEEDFAEVSALEVDNHRIHGLLPPRSVLSLALRAEVPAAATSLRNGGFEAGRLSPWQPEGDDPKVLGIQNNYPAGGLYNAFIDPTTRSGGRLLQQIDGLEPRARYRLTASCAANVVVARLSVIGSRRRITASVEGAGYRTYVMEFEAPGSGSVTLTYEAGPATLTAEEKSWATIDNVSIRRLGSE